MNSSIDLRVAELEKSLKEAKKEKLIHDCMVEELKGVAKNIFLHVNEMYSVLKELTWGNFQVEIERVPPKDRKMENENQDAVLMVYDLIGTLQNAMYINDLEELVDVLAGEEIVGNIERLKEISEIIFSQSKLIGIDVAEDMNMHLLVTKDDMTIYLKKYQDGVECKISITSKPEFNKFKVYVE